jgi:hypothetical protein
MIRLICPNLKCRAVLSVPGSARGKSVKCSQCGVKVQIPSSAPAPKKTEPASAEEKPAATNKDNAAQSAGKPASA